MRQKAIDGVKLQRARKTAARARTDAAKKREEATIVAVAVAAVAGTLGGKGRPPLVAVQEWRES